ncbi:MAG: NADH-quinone oxidoreductase subunit C [Bacillota bacterium]|nr:NADH-quinone oxidoreductase subunit C [Bacillota bacterium]
MITECKIVDKKDIVKECQELKDKGYRYVAVTCEKLENGLELTYHFDLNYEMTHLRVPADFKDTIPSISNVFIAAFLIENEYQDLFGLTFENLIIDYKGHLYLTADGPSVPLG